jgi:hypothetical protein
MKKLLFAFAILSLCFLPSLRSSESRTIFTVWDEFVKVSNSGADHATEVQEYFQHCIQTKTNPEEFYSVRAVKSLTDAASEFRSAADKLDELKRRIENPIPKGTITAKR